MAKEATDGPRQVSHHVARRMAWQTRHKRSTKQMRWMSMWERSREGTCNAIMVLRDGKEQKEAISKLTDLLTNYLTITAQ